MKPSIYHYFASYTTNSGEALVDGIAEVDEAIRSPDQYQALKSQIGRTHGIPDQAEIRIQSLGLLGGGDPAIR
jgi:hypothetical protein